MDPTYPKLNPLTRNPEIQFVAFNIGLDPNPEVFHGPNGTTATFLGRVATFATLPGYAKTPISYRICILETATSKQILLGSRCGVLHTPHLNARSKSAETIWCTNCWSSVNVPFYLYYRHYEDNVILHLPSCTGCTKRFQIWEHDAPLREGHAYLFSAFEHPQLLAKVKDSISYL